MPLNVEQRTDKMQQKRTTVLIEELIEVISNPMYENGMNASTVVNMMSDIHKYISGDTNTIIRIPAPIGNDEDRHQILHPSDSTNIVRTVSNISKDSTTSSIRKMPLRHKARSIISNSTSRSISVTSSGYSKKYIGFIDDDVDDNEDRPSYIHKGSSSRNIRHTTRIENAIVKPTPSIEKLYGNISKGH